MSAPKISIIIPSYNQAHYIEETLRSVLDQKYPALELIVFDGASTDGTEAILDRYRTDLAISVSEKDRGQSHAINKGLAKCTGDVWAYLNSDDLLSPGSLACIGKMFSDPATDWVGGVSSIFDKVGDRGEVRPCSPQSMREVLTPWNRSIEHVFPCSNVNFMRRSIFERIGVFDESYHYSMDMEYYTRAMFAGYILRRVPEVLGRWRWHEGSKTVMEGQAYHFLGEELRIARTYVDRLPEPDRSQLRSEIAEQSRWFAVRKTLNEGPTNSRKRRLLRLFRDAMFQPSLIRFRPWLGAVKRQFLRT